MIKLLWFDLESTGLDPRRDDMLEVAWAVADLDNPFELHAHCAPHGGLRSRLIAFRWAPACWPEKVREMHTKSGLLAELMDAGDDSHAELSYLHEVEQEILAVVPEEAEYEERTIIAGASVGPFDLQFLRNVMPTLAGRLGHRAYDVSAIKLFCRSLGMPKLPRADAHRAAADVLESIEHARLCVEWLRETHVRDPNRIFPETPLYPAHIWLPNGVCRVCGAGDEVSKVSICPGV